MISNAAYTCFKDSAPRADSMRQRLLQRVIAACMLMSVSSAGYVSVFSGVMDVTTCDCGVGCPAPLLLRQRRNSTTVWSQEPLQCSPPFDEKRRLATLSDQRAMEAAADRYNTWEQAESLMKRLTGSYSLEVERHTIGTSAEGRPITGMCLVSRSASMPSTPILLIVGGHHAREWISAEVALRILLMLQKQHSESRRVRRLLSELRVCVVPNLNPDGYVFSWEPGWSGTVPKRMWRKNRRLLPTADVGVDLNRNYDVAWNSADGGSDTPSSEVYRGPSPLSEPETRSFSQWHAKLPIVAFVSIHSYGTDILYPLGYSDSAVGPNEGLLAALGGLMQRAAFNTTGQRYEVMKAASAYPVSGDAVDSVHVAHSFAPSFTIETRPSELQCCGFVLSPTQIEETARECFSAVAALGEYVAEAVRRSSLTWENHSYQASWVPAVDADGNGVVDYFESGQLSDAVDSGALVPEAFQGQSAKLSGWIQADAVANFSGGASLAASVSRLLLQNCASQAAFEVLRAVYVASWHSVSVTFVIHSSRRDAVERAIWDVLPLFAATSRPESAPPLVRV